MSVVLCPFLWFSVRFCGLVFVEISVVSYSVLCLLSFVRDMSVVLCLLLYPVLLDCICRLVVVVVSVVL